MGELAEPLRPVRVVRQPGRYHPLAGFSCGAGEDPWDRHVNKVVQRLASEQAIPQTLAVLEDDEGELVGICSFWPRDLLLPLRREPLLEIPYINALGIDRRFQGVGLRDGARPADVLLAGVLDVIRTMHGGAAPYVYALVAAGNTRAHALFARHGFGELSALREGGEAIRIRAPD
ncbi:MAG TPA: GNAT family N-acetyltransferase [Solirubrobacteraceae bacterium]|nr:GNAT family N-acetyltransferase [Solirubrobacteraceae bacterium]